MRLKNHSLALATAALLSIESFGTKRYIETDERTAGPAPRNHPFRHPPDVTVVKGQDRNAICGCCGKKRKKCPNGNGHRDIPLPAHSLAVEVYVETVDRLLEQQHGVDIAGECLRRYWLTHYVGYWNDQVITPDRCAELVKMMYDYDSLEEDQTDE